MELFQKHHVDVIIGSLAVGFLALFLFEIKKRLTENNKRKIIERGVYSTRHNSKIPVINIQRFLQEQEKSDDLVMMERDCLQLTEALHQFGCVIVRDPRVIQEDNDRFLDLMEKYYEQSDGIKDARPEVAYQVGVTPGFQETPRNHCSAVNLLPDGHRPTTLCPPQADPKWRFFWRLGNPPSNTKFPSMYAEPVIPQGFPEWAETMDMWGNKMLATLNTVAMMAAQGLKLNKNVFARMMKDGPHLLAPTGSNFYKHGTLGTVLAGYHYDLNFLTIHGKSRFPGLCIWLRDGQKMEVSIPDGCLLVQAGKQAEILTGGHIQAGFHEVVVSEQTVNAIDRRRREGHSLWRVSSTCFGAIASDEILQPLAHYATEEAIEKYGSKFAGEQVLEELKSIGLAKD